MHACFSNRAAFNLLSGNSTLSNSMTTAAVNVVATRRSDRSGEQLWELVRTLTDSEVEAIALALKRFRSIAEYDDDSGAAPTVALSVTRVAGTTQLQPWTPDEFADAFLGHLRELAHDQNLVESTAVTVELGDDKIRGLTHDGFAFQNEDFPSLGGKASKSTGSNTKVSVTSDTQATSKTPKRRIKTTLISTDAPFTAVAVQPPVAEKPQVQENVWLKKDLLERRMTPMKLRLPVEPEQAAKGNRLSLLMGSDGQVPLAAMKPATPSNPWMSPPPSTQLGERKPPPITLQAKHKRSKRPMTNADDTSANAAQATQPEPPRSTKRPEMNANAARMYGYLILERFVPSVCVELQFLVSLLYRPSCATSTPCASSNEFCHNETSTAFAATTIEALEPILDRVSTDIIQLLAKSLDDLKLCGNLSVKLCDVIQKREDMRVDESAKLGCELPVETKVTAFRDYALPFCEDMDSRLNYRSPTESIIYSNREKIRDAFLSQLRIFQKRQNSLLGDGGTVQSDGGASEAKQLLGDVLPENLWWFARFFTLELVQVGSNPLGESDKELVLKIMEDKMVVKNPDRLRKLHRRFSSQKSSDMVGFGTSNQSSNSSRAKPLAPSQQQRNGGGFPNLSNKGRSSSGTASAIENNQAPGDVKQTATTVAPAKDTMRGYFTDNQLFFYHFLLSCDSYQFAELVKHQMEAQFITVWQAKTKADPRKDFTETVLRLKVLAKFLGFLRFSPQWHWSSLTAVLSSKNPALEAAQREAIATMDGSQSASAFNVLSLLEESISTQMVAKCIPWLCDYLTMALNDSLSMSTRYFQRVLLMLVYLHRSRALERLEETGMYVSMQIERLLHLLSAEGLVPRGLKWHQPQKGKLPSWMKASTVAALRCVREETELGPEAARPIDRLPFLYSSMFVQVCLSDLDDLRGFIQTRARAPITRGQAGDTSRRAILNGSDKSQALRKVRPLQVLREDQLELSTPVFAADGGNDAGEGVSVKTSRPAAKPVDTEDPLRDAFFKLYPQLKRATEFVVDIVVTNMCEHAIAKHVKPNADALIDACVDAAKLAAPSFTQLILHQFQVRLDERLEEFMSTTVSQAAREAEELCSERIEAALKPLVAPTVPEQLLVAATGLALAQAKSAVASLITRSLKAEFLKRVAARKRAIIKEAGSAAATAAAATSAADLSGEGSVARALKFSFDESTDTTQSQLDEAMQGLRRSVVGMSGAFQAASSASKVHANKRLLASLIRFNRSFRSSVEDLVEEMESLSVVAKQRHLTEFWSWTWRAVRLWLKEFTSVVTCADAPPEVMESVSDLAKTLQLVERCGTSMPSPMFRDATVALCRFVGEAALSVASLPLQDQSREQRERITATCTLLFAEVHAVASRVTKSHNWMAGWTGSYSDRLEVQLILDSVVDK